jgi:hypothetical protein
MARSRSIVPAERIEAGIVMLRGQRVMLSFDVAKLYDVEPRALVQAVKRNAERFPDDFMFQLTGAEWADLKSQFVTSSWGGPRRATPYAFTQEGVAMLSSVLHYANHGHQAPCIFSVLSGPLRFMNDVG